LVLRFAHGGGVVKNMCGTEETEVVYGGAAMRMRKKRRSHIVLYRRENALILMF
jgi:hypothetical protein